jgi:two-component system, OmpR family, phosphate regulon response regulator PhoB
MENPNQKKILIVEDDHDLEQTLRILLEDAGFQVISSVDAYGGTYLAHKESPSLIILDISMPAGGGLSLLRNIKQSIHTKGIPVIITTGTDTAENKAEADKLGIKGYIKKPYAPKELLDRIEEVLS